MVVLGLAVAVAAFVGACAMVPAVADGGTFLPRLAWIPTLDVELAFRIDGLSLLFVLLIAGIGALVMLYATSYLAGHAHYGRFFGYLLAFMLSMIGLVTADDVITLFVFWELTTVTSFLLVGFEHEREVARRNALQALLVTGAGGLALLAGLILLADAAGSLFLTDIIEAGDAVRADPRYPAILALVLIGAFTKSAQFPFHFWLPNAMAAPTPVSAYLHSATMVKAGIYLMARLHPTLGGTPEWIWTLSIVGAFTAVWASLLAVRQTDLKLALAYTTVMALGTLTMFLGSQQTVGIAAAMTFLVVHALYKCTLFLVVGNIDHATGTREVDRLGGLAFPMPVTAHACAVAALAMAGFPPFLGFIGKELKYEGALAIASEPLLAASAAIAANALMVSLAAVVLMRPFFGERERTTHLPHEAPWPMLVGPVVLAALGLILGVLPPYVGSHLIEPAVSAVLAEPRTVELSLWHGINLPLMLSLGTFALGVALYRAYRPLRDRLARLDARLPARADDLYDGAIAGLLRLAEAQTRMLQTGSLRDYLFVISAVLGLGTGATWLLKGQAYWPEAWPALAAHEWGVAALILAGTVLTVFTGSRLAAICGLSAVGAGVALIFLLFGAPDVAMTQLLVEVLFLLIIALVFLKLPGFRGAPRAGHGGRWRDGLIAGVVGVVLAGVTMAVTQSPPSLHLSEYFAATSVPEAYGRNIVNVILVDFRALDTLGEITVVAVAGLAIWALIRLRPELRRGPVRAGGAEQDPNVPGRGGRAGAR
jgi:multicomponent Na+:H+ antiporter subunit A